MLPGPAGKRRRWTAADQFLVDEANTLLNGTPFTYGHVVVDEAQDHSAVALRVIGRRSPSRLDHDGRRRRPVDHAGRAGALGATCSPTCSPSVAAAAIGRPILHDRLPGAGADPRGRQPAAAAHRCRRHRQPLGARRGRAAGVARRVTGRAGRCRRRRSWRQVKHRHRLTGVVAPLERHAAITAALAVARPDRRRPRPPARPRRRAAVRARSGEGPRVRRRRGRATRTRSSTARRAARACSTWR